MIKNISYTTPAIEQFFRSHRIHWADFYESERRIIEQIGLDIGSRVLDVGCGCGGLGLALQERFGVCNYTGVDINDQAVLTAREMNPRASFFHGDILTMDMGIVSKLNFDVVFSLSCVDWNICFDEMLNEVWSLVARGGYLIATFRLTTEAGCDDMDRSFQYINYDGEQNGERAAYIVKNAADLVRQIIALHPSGIQAYGYWGSPSVSASTPYDRLCFAAFAIRKPGKDVNVEPRLIFDLPQEILNSINLKK